MRDRCGGRSLDDASAVVKVLVSRLVAGRVEAGSEGVEPSAIGFGSRGTTVARAQVERGAHDVVRVVRGKRWRVTARSAAPYQRTTGLPILAVSRLPGFNSLWSREPGLHAYATKLDRAWPWSVRSAVKMRAIGKEMVRPIAFDVNRFSRDRPSQSSLLAMLFPHGTHVDRDLRGGTRAHPAVLRGTRP